MEIKTHLLAHKPTLGTPVDVVDGEYAIVKLAVIENMIVDEKGLVHGGFAFGLADYAAMLAVNDPNVVLGGADARFTAPVKRGDIMVAKAVVGEANRNKRLVHVEVKVDEKTVLTGDFNCYILEKHVLDS